jgi:ribosome recycling factor
MNEFLKELENNTKASLEVLKRELSGIRTNRPTPQLVENIAVEYAGSSLPIKQLGSITILPPQEIQITAWDPGSVTVIAKAIEASPVGLTPNIDRNTIRLKMPALSDERRQELAKLVKAMIEKEKIKIRSFRDNANKNIEKAFGEKQLTEDEKFKAKEKVQDSITTVNKQLDELLKRKITEINQ